MRPRYWNGVPYGSCNELVPPGVEWIFITRNGDAVDVDRFLVSARYWLWRTNQEVPRSWKNHG